MIKWLMRFSLMSGLTLISAGCASHTVRLDADLRASIRNIVVVGPVEPTQFIASEDIAVPLAVVPGLASAAAAGALNSDDYLKQMHFTETHIAKDMRAQIIRKLIADGYSVTEQLLPPPVNFNPGVPPNPAYASVSPEADAILDGGINTFYNEGKFLSSKYSPALSVLIQLRDRKTGKIIFARYYGTTDADPQYTFPSRDALMQNPDLAMQGWLSQIPPIVEDLGSDLKK